MAKPASPVRLDRDLMASATDAAERIHCSDAEKFSYCASIFHSVANQVDPDSILDVITGLAELNVEHSSAD